MRFFYIGLFFELLSTFYTIYDHTYYYKQAYSRLKTNKHYTLQQYECSMIRRNYVVYCRHKSTFHEADDAACAASAAYFAA